MELNREQIIKALECCCGGWCIRDGCPLYKAEEEDDISKCTSELSKNALSLIKAQAEDYTELDEKYRMLFEENERLRHEIGALRAENEGVDAVIDYCAKCSAKTDVEIDKTKADTVRKMHSEIERRCIKGGIYPAFVKSTIDKITKEMMEDGNNE